MSFGQAVRSVLRQYATFDGRARRSEFWWFYLAVNLMQVVLFVVPGTMFFFAVIAASTNDSNYGSNSFTMPALGWVAIGLLVIGSLASLAVTIPFYAVQARRLHDMGQSAHWIWLNFVSLGIVPLIMCAMEGNAYDNQHGPDPKAGEHGSGGYAQPTYAQPTYAQPTYAQPSYPTEPGYAAPPALPVYPAQPGYPAQPVYPAQPGFPAPPAVPGYPVPPQPPTPPASSPRTDDPFSHPGS